MRYALALPVLAILLTILACGPVTAPDPVGEVVEDAFSDEDDPLREYYVSIRGSDPSGDGSESNPWRTINYALDHIDYTGARPRLNLKRGIWEETLHISRPILIRGAGVDVVAVHPDDPDYPTREVSVVARNTTVDVPGIVVDRAGIVGFSDMVISGGGVRVVGTDFNLVNVRIDQVRGLYGIQIEDSRGVLIRDSWIRTSAGRYSDMAIDVQRSVAVIDNLEAGDYFDHIINVGGYSTLTISNSRLEGSPISYADGLRMVGPSRITVRNTTITRSHTDVEAPHGTYNRPHAAADLRGYSLPESGSPLVLIEDSTFAGFDVGLGLSVEGLPVKVQNSEIRGRTLSAQGRYYGYSGIEFPTVDLGGGALGSVGGNTFGTEERFGFHHQAPYDVTACFNDWGVLESEVPERIWDGEDTPGVGRVYWDACATAFLSAETTPGIGPFEASPSEATVCRKGPSTNFQAVRTFEEGESLFVLARDGDDSWLEIEPRDQEEAPCWVDRDDLDLRIPDDVDLGLLPEVADPITPQPANITINFNADDYSIEDGECTTLRWQVTGAEMVTVHGEEVEHTEAEQVCPSEDTGYTLEAENEAEEASSFLEIEVYEPERDPPGCVAGPNDPPCP